MGGHITFSSTHVSISVSTLLVYLFYYLVICFIRNFSPLISALGTLPRVHIISYYNGLSGRDLFLRCYVHRCNVPIQMTIVKLFSTVKNIITKLFPFIYYYFLQVNVKIPIYYISLFTFWFLFVPLQMMDFRAPALK